MKDMRKRKIKKGLTLIELIITIGILGLAVGMTAGIMISVLKSYQKASLYSEIKHNGDLVMTIFEENIRLSRSVECLYPTADSPCEVISFLDQNLVKKEFGYHVADSGACNGYFYFRDYDDTVSNPLGSQKVTNDNGVSGVNLSNVSFVLTAVSVDDKPSVSLNFDVSNSTCNLVTQRKETFSNFVIPRLY